MNLNDDDDQLLETASQLAYDTIEQVNEDLTQLQQPLQTIYCVYHAAGIINNGGFEYFFDSDFPCHPPYSFFIEAFHKIGCEQQAINLKAAADSFNLPHPEKHVDLRQDFIENHLDEKSQTVAIWSDNISGNNDIWIRLAQWIRSQPELKELLQK